MPNTPNRSSHGPYMVSRAAIDSLRDEMVRCGRSLRVQHKKKTSHVDHWHDETYTRASKALCGLYEGQITLVLSDKDVRPCRSCARTFWKRLPPSYDKGFAESYGEKSSRTIFDDVQLLFERCVFLTDTDIDRQLTKIWNDARNGDALSTAVKKTLLEEWDRRHPEMVYIPRGATLLETS